MDGLLIIDKPEGMTSHDVVNRVRRVLGTRRVGHTGTLDPFATGVMVVVVGKATRLAQFLDKDEKEYEAVVRFGFETDTGDRTGTRKEDGEKGRKGEKEIGDTLPHVDWEKTLDEFRGEIEQTPPMYSAKKVDGKKLYESARKGIEIERKAVPVVVKELEVNQGESGRDLEPGTWNLELRVVCSAGTYIRVLAEDIGRRLGVGAHLAELRRTRSGRFTIDQSVTLDELALAEDPSKHLRPIDDAVSHLAGFTLTEERAAKTRSGLSTRVQDATFSDGEALRLLTPDGELLAIGIFNAEDKSIRPKVVLV